MTKLSEKLLAEIQTVEWEVLQPHQDRDALIVVKSGLEIVDAGVAMATDNTELIQSWLENGFLSKPTVEEIQKWSTANYFLKFLIVQPFVLVQEFHVDD